MPYLIGAVLALAVGGMASIVRLDRDRAFYPTVLMVVASYYALFAVMAGGGRVLASEMVGIAVFIAAAVVGFRRSLWFAAAGLVGHGVFDALHGHLITNPGVPVWWPAFCGTYDVVAGGYLASLLFFRVVPARAL